MPSLSLTGGDGRYRAASGSLAQAESASLARYAGAKTSGRRAAEARDLIELAAQQGQVKDVRRYARVVLDVETEGGNPTAAIITAVNAAQAIAWATGDSVGAAALIDSALKRNPLDSLAELDRPYGSLAYALASMGQLPRARKYLDALVAQRVEGERRFGWIVPLTRARIAMAEKRWNDAVAIMAAPIEGRCRDCMMLTRAMAYDGRGDTDSAVVSYERYLQPLMLRGAPLAPIQRRLGELHEAKGDIERSLTWYGKFLETWRQSDPELRPQIADVTRRVARLRARQSAKR